MGRFVIILFLVPHLLYGKYFQSHDDIKSYLDYPINLNSHEKIESSLKPYLIARWNLFSTHVMTTKTEPLIFKSSNFYRKKIRQTKKLSELILMDPPRIQLKFFIKYKGVKQTKEKRPSLLLNYLAREGEIAEGFEASENLKGVIKLTENVKINSYIGFFEKWVNHRKDYEESYFLTIEHPDVKKDTKLTGTLKYALGWSYEKKIKNEKKILVDFLIQQKAYNQWKYTEQVFSKGRFSGVLFDHWELSSGMTF